MRGCRAAAALTAHDPESTWECSHIGGDRFAATMVFLPEGLSYGRVDGADVVDLANRYADGRVDDTFLRGRTCVPHTVRVMLAVSGGPACSVTQRIVMSEPLLSTCAATTPGRVRRFELLALDVDAQP